MKKTFATEDERKTKLFKAWIDYLLNLHSQTGEDKFDEIYEGLATISDLSKRYVSLEGEDGRKLERIRLTPEISQQTCREDTMYVALGLREGQWWPLDVISICSFIPGDQQKVHITFNPLYVDGSPPKLAQ